MNSSRGKTREKMGNTDLPWNKNRNLDNKLKYQTIKIKFTNKIHNS